MFEIENMLQEWRLIGFSFKIIQMLPMNLTIDKIKYIGWKMSMISKKGYQINLK